MHAISPSLYLGFGIVILILGMTLIPIRNEANHFHTPEEIAYFKNNNILPPVDSSIIFPTASHCSGCHGFDNQGNALVDSKGQDVNIHDDWRASMMANSAKDPFWRAKVSHEILINPKHAQDIETKCTKCHAPQGHYTEILRGATHYSIEEMLADTVAMDGISCSTCHMMKDSLLGDLHSGDIIFDTSRIAFGPFEFPFSQPMQSFVGFEPIYSEHINDAGICASCHSLVVETLDLEGNPTGETFVEQATYHEWLNSIYAQEKTEQTCQSCHMPRIQDSVVVSANYLFLQPRSPFAIHELVGANTMMLKLMKDNNKILQIDAEDEHFDATIAATFNMLQQKTLDTELEFLNMDGDSAYFKVALRNKAGHKFPSGYPSRRAVVEFVATTEMGDTLFQSGVLDENYEAIGINDEFEPHYDVIRAEDEVQIYEIVVSNVEDRFTTVLENGASALKDNRLPPIGFSTSNAVYDTTRIYGTALNDPNFNFDGLEEGSGTDSLFYHIPLKGYIGTISVSMKVWYQSLPPRWLAPMLAESTPEIDLFRDMYTNADRSPVLVSSKSLSDIFVEGTNNTSDSFLSKKIKLYPNPSTDGQFYLDIGDELEFKKARLYHLNGQFIQTITSKNFQVNEQGTFLLKIETDKGEMCQKIIHIR